MTQVVGGEDLAEALLRLPSARVGNGWKFRRKQMVQRGQTFRFSFKIVLEVDFKAESIKLTTASPLQELVSAASTVLGQRDCLN